MPSDRLGKSIVEEIIKNRKRTNAIVAIIKDIEKSQSLPTVAMLQSLFEQQAEQEKDSDFEDGLDFVEKKFENGHEEEEWMEETTVPRISYERLEYEMDELKKDFSYVLDNVRLVKSSFGKNRFRLELTEGEIEKFKRAIRNSM